MGFDAKNSPVRFQDLIDEGVLQIGDGYRAKNRELGGVGLIFLRAGQVTDACIEFEGVEHFHVDLTESLQSKTSLAQDTIITTKGNSTGRTAFVTGDMPQFVYSPHLSFWRSLDKSRLDPRFLRYWSVGQEFVDQLNSLKGQTDMAPYLSLRDQRRLWITLPQIDNQRRIGRILGALNDKIELNREMNATLEAMARGLFKSWFVDFDPVTARAAGRPPAHMAPSIAALFPCEFEDSEFGLIPKGWHLQPVEFFIDGLFDGPHATPAKSDSGGIFLGIKNLTGTQIDLTTIRHIAEADWARWTRRVTPRERDIVFTYEATIGHFAMIPPGTRCCLGRRLALVRPKASTEYLFHWFTSEPFQAFLEARTVHGSTVSRTSLNDFPSYPVLSPPVEIMHAFCGFATKLWSQIHKNQSESRDLAATRDTLLPELLSGRIRLRDAERMIEEVA